MLQQSHHAQFQQNVDVENQQLEAQIARIQLEKAESDSKPRWIFYELTTKVIVSEIYLYRKPIRHCIM